MKIDNETYVRAEDEKGTVYVCPAQSVGADRRVSDDTAVDCIEADVIGRYVGNIDLET